MILEKKEHYISRVDDNENRHYWLVRFDQNSDIFVQEIFTDHLYGGKKKSLAAARQFRERVRKELGKPVVPVGKIEPHENQANNKSGIIGVQLNEKIRKGNSNLNWCACWQVGNRENRKAKTKSFSVAEYGYAAAFKKAVKARYEGIGEPVPSGIKTPIPDDLMERIFGE